jgi:LL-diaminopimelate aminotransferase
MEAANRLDGIGEYYFSKKLREIDELNREGKNVINLGIGSPDLPPHADVIAELQKTAALPNTHAYQNYKGIPALRNAMSEWYRKWYGVKLDADSEILPLIGSKEGIMHICMAFLNDGDEVLIPNPGYPTYRSAVKLAGGVTVDYHLEEKNNWLPDISELTAKLNRKTKMMWINYPHMPTGQSASAESLEPIVRFAKANGILLCHDNPYSFILNDTPFSIMSIENASDCTIELNSLSKSHNMAGWRVGMLVGNKENVQQVLRFKSNMDSGMFMPLQQAAVKALGLGRDWFESLNNIYGRRRNLVLKLLDLLDCRYSMDQKGLFVWAAVPSAFSSGYELSDEILQRCAVFITPGGIFGTAGDSYVRVSLCSTEEKLNEAISRIEKGVLASTNTNSRINTIAK